MNTVSVSHRPPMDEPTLMRLIDELGRLRLGLYLYHPLRSEGSQHGWPDLVIYGPGGIVFREVKGDGGQPTIEQGCVLVALRTLGLDAALWTPDHWYDGQIANTLRRLRKPVPDVPSLDEVIAVCGLEGRPVTRRLRARAALPVERTLLHAARTPGEARATLIAAARRRGKAPAASPARRRRT